MNAAVSSLKQKSEPISSSQLHFINHQLTEGHRLMRRANSQAIAAAKRVMTEAGRALMISDFVFIGGGHFRNILLFPPLFLVVLSRK